MNEAETCRALVVPKLESAGWDTAPHSIQPEYRFTDGRIIVAGSRAVRGEQKRADYLLRYRRDLPLAVVEAKKVSKPAGAGMQQAKEYAEILGLRFAYSTNGTEIAEFDALNGTECLLDAFPTPAELWRRYLNGNSLSEQQAELLLSASYHLSGKSPRYYQEIAINRAVQAAARGRPRCLLTMATGTGKTVVAFQICWKLWNARWNRAGEYRRPRILFLADRNVLIDQPKDGTFLPFGDARHKIEGGEVVKGREMYFGIYQALARDENRPGLYRQFSPDFFDLVIVDECHRGSARDDSSWREILDHFKPAFQLGMTATPRHEDNADTYEYFGEPIYTYSLRQGISDGFLAPYRVHRVVSTVDAAGWRPSAGELDRYGRAVPDEEYQTKDFEKVVSLRARTRAIARHLTDFLKRTGRDAKTIVFCVDQEHADEMRRELTNLNSDLVSANPNYVCRVTSDEGKIGVGHLSRFQEVEPDARSPVILTTSQMLTTGVDAPTCKNVVLARVVGSMTEFKQIIGRGTRVRDDYGKLFFNILDYTGSATLQFADPAFDGDPALGTVEQIDAEGASVDDSPAVETPEEPLPDAGEEGGGEGDGAASERPERDGPRKFYVDGGRVEIVAELVYELDAEGKQLRVRAYQEFAGDRVRTLYPDAADLRTRWADPVGREEVVRELERRGIVVDALAEAAGRPDADPFDLLCHMAYNAPLRTRRERAERLRRDRKDFFDHYGPEARAVLNELLEKYADHGTAQFELPAALQVPPLTRHGNVLEIAGAFGGPAQLRQAVSELQALLYAG